MFLRRRFGEKLFDEMLEAQRPYVPKGLLKD